ncbi:ABC transporter substrate-binding protein [Bhargavaea beijingensis]|uniref:ABC transporter substrate-binding protein n=1 Tax=Bhargavaea beijingensis TaxID=426756 RepID=A0A1G6Z412_9BACL|nr:ABC transporter substrate-binding protein [Bhargavaea beijingensis]RSK36512.1 ABC transporter substrate-binding protein [Bhargavaea beijingensis]SDD97358.1 peptide/nickel transport system substrate-binding protein [Bhargavaea beijingensis]
MKGKSKIVGLLLLMLVLFLAACNGDSEPEVEGSEQGSGGEVKTGGTLEVAYPTQPQTLDPHGTTAEATRDAAKVIYEGLVTINENYEVIPQLADSFEVSDDNKKVTFKLREGVLFHNGEEMTSADVVASMQKWAKSKPELGEHEWVAADDYTVELNLSNPSSLIMHFLADVGNLAAIMPKEVAESADATGAKEYIGTGPFQFVEWKQDEVIQFKKFEDYVADEDATDGLGGKKEAFVDSINWRFVPDASTRVNGLMSGQYHFAHMLSYDSIPQVEGNPQVEVDVWPYGIEGLVFNKKEGLFTDVKARQAVNYALDMEVIMSSAFTGEDYYDLDPSLFLESQVDWYTDTGKENYNQKDVDKAKQLLEESGYNGEEIVILTSRDYEHHYNAAVATQQQLEEIGMNVKLDVYDWPTLLERRNDPSAYNIFYTGFSTTFTPHQFVFLDSATEWPGWTNNPDIDRLLDEINVAASQDEAKELYAQLQQLMWEDLPIINTGTNSRVSGYSKDLSGYTNLSGPNFWNVSINQ